MGDEGCSLNREEFDRFLAHHLYNRGVISRKTHIPSSGGQISGHMLIGAGREHLDDELRSFMPQAQRRYFNETYQWKTERGVYSVRISSIENDPIRQNSFELWTHLISSGESVASEYAETEVFSEVVVAA